MQSLVLRGLVAGCRLSCQSDTAAVTLPHRIIPQPKYYINAIICAHQNHPFITYLKNTDTQTDFFNTQF